MLEQEGSHPETVPTELEAWKNPKSLCQRKHPELLSLELRGKVQPKKKTVLHHNPPSTKPQKWCGAIREPLLPGNHLNQIHLLLMNIFDKIPD